MIAIRRRKRDRQLANERIEEAVRRVIDVAIRRSRLEADVAVIEFRARKGAPHDRSD